MTTREDRCDHLCNPMKAQHDRAEMMCAAAVLSRERASVMRARAEDMISRVLTARSAAARHAAMSRA